MDILLITIYSKCFERSAAVLVRYARTVLVQVDLYAIILRTVRSTGVFVFVRAPTRGAIIE